MTTHPSPSGALVLVDGDDLLQPVPVSPGGVLIGYARVSTKAQNLDRQMIALKAAGCAKIFADKLSGKNADRPELIKCLEYARPGDAVVVTELSRMGRSLKDLITIVGDLRTQGIGFKSLKEQLDTSSPAGRLIFHVFAALAEFLRELILENSAEGLEAAKERGVRLGRPPAMNPQQVQAALDLLANPRATVSSIAKILGVHRSTLYAHLPELKLTRAKARAGQLVDASRPASRALDPDGSRPSPGA
ncbi:recombinase family protein [Hamadaea sp. NPDC051192]|uniref:recombinase family protein n=1 Tax=Hamadaea sp. NPDC051192 TaxID=3154940 RepID=UPI0034487133